MGVLIVTREREREWERVRESETERELCGYIWMTFTTTKAFILYAVGMVGVGGIKVGRVGWGRSVHRSWISLCNINHTKTTNFEFHTIYIDSHYQFSWPLSYIVMSGIKQLHAGIMPPLIIIKISYDTPRNALLTIFRGINLIRSFDPPIHSLYLKYHKR